MVQKPGSFLASCRRLFLPGILAVASLLCGPPKFAMAGDLKDADRDRVLTMLAKAKEVIEADYYDPSVKGPKLDAAAQLARERIQKAESIGDAFAAVGQFVLDLNDSHTFFYPPRTRDHSDYGWQLATVGSRVYVLTVDSRSDAARQGIAPGDEVIAINGLALTRKSLSRIQYLFGSLRQLPGLHVELKTPDGIVRELDVAALVTHAGFVVDLDRDTERVESLRRGMKPIITDDGGPVLVARIPSFEVPDYEMEDILHRARGKDSLVLDLRGNGGGSSEALMVLLGGLFSQDLQVATSKERLKTHDEIAKGSGDHAFKGRIFALVDAGSASASEIFARTMQLKDRGTVIGDTTSGSVMAARLEAFLVKGRASIYSFEITVADLTMPDGQRLENVGVTPDFMVLPSAADLRAGRDPAMEKAMTFARTPLYAAGSAATTSN